MDWLVSLFTEHSIAHDVLVYALVIALGVLLGKIKFFGISLGVTFVLFVGIVLAHFGQTVGSVHLLNFIRDFGLILFVFSIGIQVGPGFFSSFKKGGIRMNMLAVFVVLLNVAVAMIIYFCNRDSMTISEIVGILSGAVTNTPGLGAAQQALESKAVDGTDALSMGYAAAYPLGVVGIILSMIVLKAIFRVKVEDEIKEIESEMENSVSQPSVQTYRVENDLISGKSIKELIEVIDHDFIISRMKKESGEIIINQNKEELKKNYLKLNEMTELACAPDKKIRGIVNFASPLVLFYSDIADSEYQLNYYNKLMVKYIYENGIFLITANFKEDPLGFPTSKNLTVDELQQRIGLEINNPTGVIYDDSGIWSKRMFPFAHTSYWSARRTFAKAVVKSFINGYKFQYDKEYQSKILEKRNKKFDLL